MSTALDGNTEPLHNNELMLIDELIHVTGRDRSTIYAAMNNGTFPRPARVRVKYFPVWRRDEVEEWRRAYWLQGRTVDLFKRLA